MKWQHPSQSQLARATGFFLLLFQKAKRQKDRERDRDRVEAKKLKLVSRLWGEREKEGQFISAFHHSTKADNEAVAGREWGLLAQNWLKKARTGEMEKLNFFLLSSQTPSFLAPFAFFQGCNLVAGFNSFFPNHLFLMNS